MSSNDYDDDDENENDKTLMSSKDENEKQNKLLNNDNNANAKNKKTSTNTKKDDNKNMLQEYMGDVDDEVFKEYSKGKNFNSFINKFDLATNEEDKENVVRKLKEINCLVKHYAQMEDDFSEYKCKLFIIINAADYFLDELSKKLASDFNSGGEISQNY